MLRVVLPLAVVLSLIVYLATRAPAASHPELEKPQVREAAVILKPATGGDNEMTRGELCEIVQSTKRIGAADRSVGRRPQL